MPFTSYAQNHEDVILWRALKGVPRGFYIDVGASHPVIDSVTAAFYERGWHGLNLEPVEADFRLLKEQRPVDTNLQVAAGDRETTLPLFQFGVRGLSTLSPAVTERHKSNGLNPHSTEVKVRPLRDICAEQAVTEVHFLKIDVEGAEADVIRGMDFRRWRPWVLMIEATLPNSREQAHQAWEPMLLEQDYRYVYFDGLSRYYVSAERQAQLGEALACQPNIFDDYVPAAIKGLADELEQHKKKLQSLEQSQSRWPDERAMRERMMQLEAAVAHAETEVAAAREAFSTADVRARAAERTAEELSAQLSMLQNDPYFTAKKTIRRLAGRLTRRFTD